MSTLQVNKIEPVTGSAVDFDGPSVPTYKGVPLGSGGGGGTGDFNAGLTGAVTRTVTSKLRDTISLFDFMTTAEIASVQAGNLALDVTAAVQACLDQGKYKHIIAPPGKYRLSTSLNLDPTASYWISGASFDINSNLATVFHSTGNFPVISIDNLTTNNYNPDIVLEHFCINGTNAGTNQHGIFARRTPVSIKEVYVVNCQHGIWIRDGFTSSLQNTITANNYQHGVFLDRVPNQILLSHCISNGNARTGGGYAGFAIQGASTFEGLAVTMVSCDATSNGTVSGNGSGVTLSNVRGITMIGHYSESNRTFAIYADNTVTNLTVTGGSFSEEEVRLLEVNGLHYLNNRHEGYTASPNIKMKITIQAQKGSDCLIRGNTYGGTFGVIKNFYGGAGERREHMDAAPPSVSSTIAWQTGDIVWNTAPATGTPVGWVCTVGGPTGTWRPFGAIS